MRFENYNIAPEIKQSLEESDFKRPTDIQFKAIPPIMRGEDVLAIAQTGTGKTAAFAIPVIDYIFNKKKRDNSKGIKCLVMVPTRELALQNKDVFQKIGKYTGLKVFAIYGGVEQDNQIDQLQSGIDVLIATPGRMFDLTHQGHISYENVEILILDEADRMLDLGFIKDIRDLIRFLPDNRQTLFFSATINLVIKDLAYSLVRNAIRIQISPKDPVSKNVDHSVVFVEMDDKRFFLERIVKENPESKILVFVRTKVRAERVLKAMERVQIECLTIHSDKEQKERTEVMNKFKEGTCKILVATDISARGIDIPGVQFVINYDLPDIAENYVHRIGRTGRGNNRGRAISFCSTEEKDMLAEIEEFMDKKITLISINITEYEKTIDYSDQSEHDWKSVVKEIEESEKKRKKKKK